MEEVIRPVKQSRGMERLPIVLQSEFAECGLCCLVMVANFHGNGINLAEFRLRDPVSMKGISLLSLMRDAVALGLTPRALRLELEELEKLQAPCILHWNLNHFVVLKEVRRDVVVIHDPARGSVVVPMAEAGRHFTGVALELTPSLQFVRARRRKQSPLFTVLAQVTGLKRALLHVLALSLVIEGFVVVTPFYMQWVLDQVIVARDDSLLVLIGIGFGLLAIFRPVVTALRAWNITWLGANLNNQWESNLFRHLLHLPATFFERRHVGDVVSRFTSVKSIQNVLSGQFVATILDGVMCVFTLVLMFLYSAKLAACVLIAFAAYLLLRAYFFAPLRSANEEKIAQAARQQSSLLEAIRGIRSLQLANQQASRLSSYGNALAETINRDVVVQRWQLGFELANGLLFGVFRVGVVWYAATLVMDGEMTVGMLVSFIAYADLFSTRGANFVDQFYEIRMLGMHAERVAEIAAARPEQALEGSISGPVPEGGSLQVQGLRFRYGRNEPWIFDGLDLDIAEGECVAIIGASGNGKSTLAKIILGLLEPEEGEVRWGGTDIRKLGKARFRDIAAAVLQDDSLFAGSIAANIAFFAAEWKLEDVQAAAGMAQIHGEIMAMPMGYDTPIGDKGAALSGGQRQRVLLARALYRRPQLLILVEATCLLDSANELRVNEVVSTLRLTRIVIAHRQETINIASRVIELRRVGSHQADRRLQADEMWAETPAVRPA